MQMVSARKAGTPAAEKGRHMDLNLSEEEREIREWVRTFVRKEIAPLEPDVLARERRNEQGLRPDELTALQEKAKRSGFFGVHTPEEYGGMGLGAMMSALIEVELGRSFVPFRFGGEADNILYFADEEQRQRYLVPTINGDRRSCFAITEPGAGSDARAIRTSARREGDSWVINGEKTFITRGHEADFCMVRTVTVWAADGPEPIGCSPKSSEVGDSVATPTSRPVSATVWVPAVSTTWSSPEEITPGCGV